MLTEYKDTGLFCISDDFFNFLRHDVEIFYN